MTDEEIGFLDLTTQKSDRKALSVLSRFLAANIFSCIQHVALNPLYPRFRCNR